MMLLDFPVFYLLHACLAESASTSVTENDALVIVEEGGDVEIVCISSGSPIPSVSWIINDQATPFDQIDNMTNSFASLQEGVVPNAYNVTPGNIRSTLQIMNASFPEHDGEYECVGNNTEGSSSDNITVQVQG